MLALCLAAGALLSTRASAQRPDSVPARDSARASDTSLVIPGRIVAASEAPRPPISARRALLYSMLVPGLGQTRLDRPNAGALFASVEVAAVVMARKAAGDLRFARAVARTRPAIGYQVDENGLPRRDSTGALVPIARETNRYTSRLRARRTQFEDWMAVVAFNHLISGADAFVAAQLWDMPARPSLRVAPGRGYLVGVSVDFGRRAAR